MIKRAFIVAVVLGYPHSFASAQDLSDADAARIGTVAVRYAQARKFPNKHIIIDAAGLRANRALPERIATNLQVALVRSDDARKCLKAAPGTVAKCTIAPPGAVLVAIGEPTTTGNTARVTVVWEWEFDPGRLAAGSLTLELIRQSTGWAVARVVAEGAS